MRLHFARTHVETAIRWETVPRARAQDWCASLRGLQRGAGVRVDLTVQRNFFRT